MKSERIVLYTHQSSDIEVSMEMYFNEKGELIFDGYDIGKIVEEYHGDSDYEYTYTIQPEELNKFYPIFGLDIGDKIGLLTEIQKRFGVNEAYSLFGEFMRKNNIEFKHFTWS